MSQESAKCGVLSAECGMKDAEDSCPRPVVRCELNPITPSSCPGGLLFPSPPRVSFPIRDERLALRGPPVWEKVCEGGCRFLPVFAGLAGSPGLNRSNGIDEADGAWKKPDLPE